MTTRRQATLIDAWVVIGRVSADLRDIGVYIAALNIVWFFSSALIVTAPPAMAALYAVTREFGYGNRIDWLDFFRLMRRYSWTGWRWGILNIGVSIIYWSNLQFYTTLEEPFNLLVQAQSKPVE